MQGQMRTYIFKRLLLMIPTLLGVLTFKVKKVLNPIHLLNFEDYASVLLC